MPTPTAAHFRLPASQASDGGQGKTLAWPPSACDRAAAALRADLAAGVKAKAQAATPGQGAGDPEHGQGARDLGAGEVRTNEAVGEALIEAGEGHYGATSGLGEGVGAEAEASTHHRIEACKEEGIENGGISRAGGGDDVVAGVEHLQRHRQPAEAGLQRTAGTGWQGATDQQRLGGGIKNSHHVGAEQTILEVVVKAQGRNGKGSAQVEAVAQRATEAGVTADGARADGLQGGDDADGLGGGLGGRH